PPQPPPTPLPTLSLHDALPISLAGIPTGDWPQPAKHVGLPHYVYNVNGNLLGAQRLEFDGSRSGKRRFSDCPDGLSNTVACRCGDRKSTRLNSSHVSISYAGFC